MRSEDTKNTVKIFNTIEAEQHLKSLGRDQRLLDTPSGFPSLDRAAENLCCDGELVVVSGETKNGKTLFCQSITANISQKNIFPLWMSYELPMRRFLGCFDENERPFMYVPEFLRPHDVEWVCDTMLKAYEMYGIRVTFIDHLHYLVDLSSKSLANDIGNVIRRFHRLIADNGLMLFIMAHVQKNSQNEPISYRLIRDSSIITQESDAVIMIRRVKQDLSYGRLEFHRRTGAFETPWAMRKVGDYLREIEYRFEDNGKN
jgi:replicative DNA helicase